MSSSESTRETCLSCGVTVDPTANFCPQCGTAAGDTFCQSCGNAFDPDDLFCTQCGHSRTELDRATAKSSTSGETRTAFRRRVRHHLEAGWELQDDQGDRVTLVDREIGSLPIHILLLFFTSGIGNLFYGWYHYSRLAKNRYLSIGDGRQPQPPEMETQTADQTSDVDNGLTSLSGYGLSGLVLLISLVFLAAAAGAGSLASGAIGTVLALGGLAVLPPVRHRLNRRHGVTKFGRLRTVDHRVIPPTEACEDRCVVCGTQITGGLVRRRRDETVVAGVPVSTHRLQHNHYCTQCAKAELLVAESGFTADETEVETLSAAEVGSDSSS